MDWAVVESKELFMGAQLIIFGLMLLVAEVCDACFHAIPLKTLHLEKTYEYWDRFLLTVSGLGILMIGGLAISNKVSTTEILLLIIIEFILFFVSLIVTTRRNERAKRAC